MNRVLITSGPTREFLDPVRFLSNSSSGRMGTALATAALAVGFDVVVVSGPVQVMYPPGCRIRWVQSTQQMLEAAVDEFPGCRGIIAAAAPCDYHMLQPAQHKLKKTGQPLLLELHETPDILSTLAAMKRADQFSVGFALETEQMLHHGQDKMRRKGCDLMVLNALHAMESIDTAVTLIEASGAILDRHVGPKTEVAEAILQLVASRWPPAAAVG